LSTLVIVNPNSIHVAQALPESVQRHQQRH